MDFAGREIKPGLIDKAGIEFDLIVMWKMDSQDPYPGEYALSTRPSCKEMFDQLGLGWIASGDVEPIVAR